MPGPESNPSTGDRRARGRPRDWHDKTDQNKALLAFMPEDRRAAVLQGRELTRYTEHTLTSRDALDRDLATIRARGYAVDADEKTLGMRCIAAPVHDVYGEAVAGISVSGPTSRIADGDIARLGDEVTAAARQLSADIGGISPDGA